MGFIPAVSAILGVLGAAGQSNAGRGLVNKGTKYQDEAVSNAGGMYRKALGIIQEREAQGAYNAEKALRLLGDQASHDLTLKDNSTASSLATLGYKRGDSVFTQESKKNSESANLQLRRDLLDATNAYDQKHMADLGMVGNYGNAYNSILANTGSGLIERGQQQSQNAFGGLTSLVGSGGLSKIDWNWLKGGRA